MLSAVTAITTFISHTNSHSHQKNTVSSLHSSIHLSMIPQAMSISKTPLLPPRKISHWATAPKGTHAPNNAHAQPISATTVTTYRSYPIGDTRTRESNSRLRARTMVKWSEFHLRHIRQMSMSHSSEIAVRQAWSCLRIGGCVGRWVIVRVSLRNHVCSDSKHAHEHELIVKMYHL